MSRYSACNLRFIINYSIAINKSAHISRYTIRNTVLMAKLALLITVQYFNTSCNIMHSEKIMIIIIKSAHISRYSACNLRFIITYSIAINKSAHSSRYTIRNTVLMAKLALLITVQYFNTSCNIMHSEKIMIIIIKSNNFAIACSISALSTFNTHNLHLI